jgi:large subunit ribosomal protein L10
MFTKEQKKVYVQDLQNKLEKASLVVLTDYKGLDVEKISDFRSKLYERYGEDSNYIVTKNTLFRIALRNAGYEEEEWGEYLSGTIAALIITEDDCVEAIKILADFNKKNKLPVIKAGYLEGRFFDESKVEEYSKLPTKKDLVAQVVGGIAAPITGLVYTLNGVITKFLYALNAIKDHKE